MLYRRKPGTTVGKGRGVDSPKPLHVVVALAGERSPTKATVGALR